MAKRRRTTRWIAAVVVFALGGYLVADAFDVIPGYLTVEPVPGPPAAFPTPPGAVEPEDSQAAPHGAQEDTPANDVDIAGLLKKVVKDRENMGKSVAAVVTDAVTGEVLAQRRPQAQVTPASTQKILTAYAAGVSLDLDSTVSTTVVQESDSSIVLVGGGDMMLNAEQSDPSAVNGRAGLADLAEQVAEKLSLRGNTTIELGYDTSLFDAGTHQVWSQSPSEGYAAPVVPLAVDVGRIKEGEYAPRYDDPARAAAETFATRLEEHDITVSQVRRVKASEDAQEIARVESAPLYQIIRYFMEHSDNTITEVVGRLVAIERELPASFDGATKAVLATLTEQGIDVGNAKLTDCSGLADGSRLSVELLVQIIGKLTEPGQGKFHDIAAALPISGWTGTLASRLNSEDAIGNVRAKTGSLPKVVALAGTVRSASGRPLNFAIITDRSPNTWASRKIIDEFVTELTQ